MKRINLYTMVSLIVAGLLISSCILQSDNVPSNKESIYQLDLHGIEDGDILLAGSTRYIYITAKGTNRLTFTWEDSTGVIQTGRVSALQYTVPSTHASNYLILTITVDGSSEPRTIRINYKVLLPTIIATIATTDTVATATATAGSAVSKTPKPPTPAPTTSPLTEIVYEVKSGDTILGISRYLFNSIAYGNEITKTNCLVNANIFPGQKLNLKYYTVQSNDALSLIAERYGTPMETLLEINDGIEAGWLIQPGDYIFFPSKTCG